MRTFTKKTVMHSYPGMVALVTATWEGKTNIMSAGWHTYISYEPPIYGVAIAKERFTHHLIEGSKEFSVNFVTSQYADYIQHFGSNSGKDENKFEKVGANYESGKTVQSPILDHAYIAYECKVMDQQTYGDHDFFVGKITGFHKDESLFQQNGLPNFQKLSIPLYLGRSQYLITNGHSEVIDLYNRDKGETS